MIQATKEIFEGKFCYVIQKEGKTVGRCFYDPTEGEIFDYEYYDILDRLDKNLLFLSVLGYLDEMGHRTVICSCSKDMDIINRLGFKQHGEDRFILDLNGFFNGCENQ